ncbi:peptidylprolyl isomerase [Spongiibacter sp. IMCC21906]|uniref:peptidylprolyl isomerase n=1 Tax=Spongiibacter sp. IMCC21906 TaxID=1620392 RepID=UPI00069B866F|nr:peptidylprolyl isomerase [Spongiibacter sp. IMCC21906]
MNKMRVSHVLMIALMAIMSSFANADVQWLDRIAAIVDDDVILISELDNRLQTVKNNIQRAGQTAPPDDQLRKEILDMLILESIQLQMANRVGLRIDDEELNQAVTRIAAQNNMSLEQFRQALISNGSSYLELREQVRREMIIQRVQAGNVNQRIQVTEQEVDNYLKSEEGQARTSPDYRLAHVLIPVPSDASEAQRKQAKAKAEAVAKALRNGASYENVNGVQGSDLGWRKQQDLPSLFADVTSSLQDGDVSEPLQSASGYHVVQLLASRGVAELVDQTKVRHILLKTSAIRDEEQSRQLAADLRQRVKQGESFAELAKKFSEDIGSAQEGGSLGWTTPGQLVPEFEKAMDNTAVGDISPPVKSNFGWHIIKVEERRREDVTNEIRERLARRALHDRKFDQELEAWLRKIRSEAFVDEKL